MGNWEGYHTIPCIQNARKKPEIRSKGTKERNKGDEGKKTKLIN